MLLRFDGKLVYLPVKTFYYRMIEFQTYDVDMPAIDFARVRSWIGQVCRRYERQPGELVYQFCSDEHILEVLVGCHF